MHNCTNDAKMPTQKTLAKPKTKAKNTRCSIQQSPFKPGMLRFPRSSLDVRQSVGNFKSGSAELVPLKWSWHPCVISELFSLDTLGECQFYLCLCRSSLFLSCSLKKIAQRTMVTAAEVRMPATEAVTGPQ